MADWDGVNKIWGAAFMDKLHTQIAAVNTSKENCLVTYCPLSQYNTQFLASKKFGYVQHIQYVWHKKKHQVTKPTGPFVPCIENLMVAFKPSAKAVGYYGPHHPEGRQNIISVSSVPQNKKHRYIDGSVVNVAQKPPEIARRFAHDFCPSTHEVLIVGGGAGGDVEGCVYAHRNVTVLEKDPRQYEHLCTMVMGLEQARLIRVAKEKEDLEKKVEDMGVELDEVLDPAVVEAAMEAQRVQDSTIDLTDERHEMELSQMQEAYKISQGGLGARVMAVEQTKQIEQQEVQQQEDEDVFQVQEADKKKTLWLQRQASRKRKKESVDGKGEGKTPKKSKVALASVVTASSFFFTVFFFLNYGFFFTKFISDMQ